MSFAELRSALLARQADGLVQMAHDPDVPRLELWCYTREAQYAKRWDDVTKIARGLVLDVDARRVLATPLPKFFNYGELSASVPPGRFCVYDKLDGSCGIVFWDGARWRVATKGSLTSSQSQWGGAWLDAHADLAKFEIGTTYVFEIVYAENRIVVHYAFEGLVALTAYHADGTEFTRDEIVAFAQHAGTRVCDAYDFATFDEMVAAVKAFTTDREGVVVRFEDGMRLKVKGDEYLRVHRLVSRVTPLAVWDAMQSGADMALLRREIPEEFHADFDAILGALRRTIRGYVDRVDVAMAACVGLTNKEIGLRLREFDDVERMFIFTARSGGATWPDLPMARKGLYRLCRPTWNVLPGYTPSTLLNRVLEEEA